MPNKRKDYNWTKFSPDVIKRAQAVFLDHSLSEPKSQSSTFQVKTGAATWTLDSEEEFFSEYRGSSGNALYRRERVFESGQTHVFSVAFWENLSHQTSANVRLESRAAVEAVFEVFEDALEVSSIKPAPKPAPKSEPPIPVTIFIGHGKSGDWRDLADHLRDHQHLSVETFESKPRAGMNNFEVVLHMARTADFAVLVHTPEDETVDGTVRARQNVVHETGVFQAVLGPHRAIIVRKDGCDDFSNVAGVQEIRYETHIREVFGEVLAVIKREYPALNVPADRRTRSRL